MVRVFTNSVCDLDPGPGAGAGGHGHPDVIAFRPRGASISTMWEIDPPALYEKLARCQELPTTSHPNLDQYMRAFR